MAKWMNGDFYDDEIDALRQAYIDMKNIRSDSSGSAMGEHYKLAKILKNMGVHTKFEASSQIENYIEAVLTTGRKPDVY